VYTCKYTCNLQNAVLTEQLHLFPLLASEVRSVHWHLHIGDFIGEFLEASSIHC